MQINSLRLKLSFTLILFIFSCLTKKKTKAKSPAQKEGSKDTSQIANKDNVAQKSLEENKSLTKKVSNKKRSSSKTEISIFDLSKTKVPLKEEQELIESEEEQETLQSIELSDGNQKVVLITSIAAPLAGILIFAGSKFYFAVSEIDASDTIKIQPRGGRGKEKKHQQLAIVFSDLDDTLKKSKDGDLLKVIKNYMQKDGPEVYTDLKEIMTGITQSYQRYEINYVTASPAILRLIPGFKADQKKWLQNQGVPFSTVMQPKLSGGKDFKVKTILDHLKALERKGGLPNYPEKVTVYLFGDSGRHDPEVYAEVITEARKLPMRNQFDFKVQIREVSHVQKDQEIHYKKLQKQLKKNFQVIKLKGTPKTEDNFKYPEELRPQPLQPLQPQVPKSPKKTRGWWWPF